MKELDCLAITVALLSGEAAAQTTGPAQTTPGTSATQVIPWQADDPALSDAATSTGSPAAPDTTGVQDIVVTAQRRSENLQKVPIAILVATSS